MKPGRTADGVWHAYSGEPALCETCAHRNHDPAVRRMCLVDPLKTYARTCRSFDEAAPIALAHHAFQLACDDVLARV